MANREDLGVSATATFKADGTIEKAAFFTAPHDGHSKNDGRAVLCSVTVTTDLSGQELSSEVQFSHGGASEQFDRDEMLQAARTILGIGQFGLPRSH